MIPDEVFERGALQHKDFVVGRFFGRVPAFKIIQNVLNFLWGKGNKLEIHMIQSTRSMIVRIPSDYIREKVLKKRIWYVDTAMFHVAQWSDGEVADTSSLEVIPIWAHLIGVPFDLMTNEGLGWIADALGEPKEMDDWTKNLSSLSVAHVKVEADATKPFPTVLELVRQSGAMFRVEVEYPWLPPSCSHCKELGHIIKDCLKIKRQWVPVNKAKGTQDSGNTPDPVVITVHEPMSEDPQASNPNGIVEDSSRAQTPPPPSSIGDPKPVSTAMEIDPLRSPLASTLPPTTPNPTPPCPLLHPPQSPTLPSSPNPLDSPISPCLPPLNYVLALAATVMPKSSILPHTVNSCAALSVPADPPFPLPEDVFVSQAPYLITNDVVAFPPLSSSKWESPKRKKKYFTKLTTPPPPVKNSSSFNSFSPLTDSSLSHPSLPCPASSSTSRPPDQNPSNHSSDLTSSTHPTSSSVLPPVPSFGESYPVADGDIEKFWVINTRQKHSWLVNKLLDAREIIYPWIRQRVQNGETTYFWSTNWSPYGKLTDYLHTPGAMRFPVNKNATIAELWKNGAWVLPNARSDRQVEVISYLTILTLNQGSDEAEWWPGDQKNAKFQTGAIYDLLRPSTPTVPWHKEVWFSGGIPKHMFLVWLMVKNRCPIRDRLLSWGLQTDPRCLYCNVADESIAHCFFECNFAWDVWRVIAAKCSFNSPRQWQRILLQLQRPTTNKTNKTLLLLCWQATLYTLWTERNNRLHNAQFSSPEILVSQIKLIIKNRAFSLRIDRPKLASSLLQLWFST
uniref:DUF4283 domain-containing protein n=1 Tax=Brassica campestris TaxID=3711 RepID=M4EYP0_BRACM